MTHGWFLCLCSPQFKFSPKLRQPLTCQPSSWALTCCEMFGVCVNRLFPSPLLQIHAHYELKKSSRHRRNLAITGGVALSIITAPVIAAVSVGKKPDMTAIYHPLWIKTNPAITNRAQFVHSCLDMLLFFTLSGGKASLPNVLEISAFIQWTATLRQNVIREADLPN